MLQFKTLCVGICLMVPFSGWASDQEVENRGIKRVLSSMINHNMHKAQKATAFSSPTLASEPLYTDNDVLAFSTLYGKLRAELIAKKKLTITLKAEFTVRHMERFPELKDKTTKRRKISYEKLNTLIEDLTQLKTGRDESLAELEADFKAANRYKRTIKLFTNINRKIDAVSKMTLIFSKYGKDTFDQFKDEYNQVKASYTQLNNDLKYLAELKSTLDLKVDKIINFANILTTLDAYLAFHPEEKQHLARFDISNRMNKQRVLEILKDVYGIVEEQD